MSFYDWLNHQESLTNYTRRRYVGAVTGMLSAMAGVQIGNLENLDEFDQVASRLRVSDAFKRSNADGHRMYSAALSQYRKYLEFLNEGRSLEIMDLEDIEADKSLSSTESLALRKARLGQGDFRAGLIRQWHGKCSVTGYPDARLLIASHIKPWCQSNNQERLDSNNGLLLTPNLDKVFDLGLISFEPTDGKIIFSPSLTEPLALGLSDSMQVCGCSEKTASYLSYHNRNIFVQ